MDLDWAPLYTLDISQFDDPHKRKRLAKELEDAVKNIGFWAVTGHGISNEEVLQMLAIGNAFFHLPMEDKVKVPIDLEHDLNWGFREPIRKLGDSDWTESVQTYELHKPIDALKDVKDHDLIKQNYDTINPFMQKMYERIARPLFILIAMILELPDDYFTSRIEWEKRSDCWLRYMFNPPRPSEYYIAARKYGISSHSDQSALTLYYSLCNPLDLTYIDYGSSMSLVCR